jgi:tetratricopeptide (TPR) repeat protein
MNIPAMIAFEVVGAPEAQWAEALERLCGERSLTPADVERVKPLLARMKQLRQARGHCDGDRSGSAVEAGPALVPGYRVLGELGRGGTAVVYRAQDLRLNRLVALKMLNAVLASPERRRRLQTEAEAAARLQHPNIVQVFEVGEREGQPYIVLELCPGGSLTQVLGRGPLPPREAAEQAVVLAEAVAAAHQAGVVHRDLKPANVLLADGKLKISDFGLAKLLDRDAGQTQTEDILGTPSYMAPEQASGGARDVAPAADIYALGAILYECLTGRPPFKAATPLETILQVASEEPVPPRRLLPSVPRDLETICLKCLSKEPRRRYDSAQELADDLRRFQEGKPIVARPVGAFERVVKWTQRRPAAAAVATAAALSLAALLVSGAYFTSTLAESNQQLTKEKGKTQEALERSQRAETSASEQHQLALKTIDRVVHKIQDRLQIEPNWQELRKELLAEALAGLNGLARAAAAAEANHQTIHTLLKLGDIFRDIEIGGIGKARSQYEKAHELAARLAEADAENAQAQSDLAISLNSLGDVYRAEGDSGAAMEFYNKSVEIHRKLAQADANDAQAQQDWSTSLDRLGNMQWEQGDKRAALESYKTALAIDRKLADADPHDTQAQRNLAVSLIKMGDMQLEAEDREAALESYKGALDICRKLANSDPKNTQDQQNLSASLGRLGNVQLAKGDRQSALESYKEALVIDRKLALADPMNAQVQRGLSVSLNKLGAVQLKTGDIGAAFESYKESLDLRRKLATAEPKNAIAQRDLAISLGRLGVIQEENGDGMSARNSYREALSLFRKLADADRKNAQAQRDLLIIYEKSGRLEERLTEFRQAASWYDKALEVAQAFPKPEVFNKEVGEVKARLSFCRAAEQILDNLVVLDKQPPAVRFELLSAVHRALVKRKEYRRAVQAAEKLSSIAEKSDELYDAACAFTLCVPLADQEDAKESLAVKAIDLLKKAGAKGFKSDAKLKRDANLDALRKRDDFKKFVAEFERELKKNEKTEGN